MKCVKKLVALLLTAVMAMTLLTACGGGSSSGAGNGLTDKSDELTKLVNSDLKIEGSKVQITYDVELSKKAKTFYDTYTEKLKGIENPTAEQKREARVAGREAAGIQGDKYITCSYTENDPSKYKLSSAAEFIAEVIVEEEKEGNVFKKVGYATALNGKGQPIGLWAILEK